MKFSEPSKKIFDSSDLNNFRRSIAFHNIQDSIKSIVLLVRSHELPRNVLDMTLVETSQSTSSLPSPMPNDITVMNHNVKVVIELLEYLNSLIDQVPPLEGPRRFGNLAVKDWHKKMNSYSTQKLSDLSISGINKSGFLIEITYYFISSFGSNIRLDYGTGHELSFVAFIGSLLKFNVLKDVNGQDILIIFAKYYDLVRKLILTYNLEPAGSHGVWGLDDHFHFIYILGAAQFNDPKSQYAPPVNKCLNDGVIKEFLSTNLYINALSFIRKIKSGPFSNHSPLIYDIHTTVSLWKKVLSGLLKMYDAEVLGKFPVVQHFWFGSSLYPWKDENFSDLPVNPISRDQEFLNDTGVKTTKDNISMTGAPWLRDSTATRVHNTSNSSRMPPTGMPQTTIPHTTIPSTRMPPPTRIPPKLNKNK